jgi:hypothetical protein
MLLKYTHLKAEVELHALLIVDPHFPEEAVPVYETFFDLVNI